MGVSDTDIYIKKSSSSIKSKNMDNKYRNEHLTIWFIKRKNNYQLFLSNGLSITETIRPTSFNTNKLFIEFNHYVKRIGYTEDPIHTTNTFNKINFIEKTKGTYFI